MVKVLATEIRVGTLIYQQLTLEADFLEVQSEYLLPNFVVLIARHLGQCGGLAGSVR